jgi:hypothetical protein
VLTIQTSASGHHALVVALRWWSLGIVLAISYFIVAYRFLFGAHGEEPPEREHAKPALRPWG